MKKNPLLNLEDIAKEVNKYLSNNNPSNPGLLSTESKERRLFSSAFQDKLSSFDRFSSDLERGPVVGKTSDGFVVEPVIDLYERPTQFQVSIHF